MVKRRLTPPGTTPPPIRTEAEHQQALRELLHGRKPPVRAQLIEEYLAAIDPGPLRRLAKLVAEQISAEMGKRGRRPRDGEARSSSQRTIESRQNYKEDVAQALTWLLSRMTASEQQVWIGLFPTVAERGIPKMPAAVADYLEGQGRDVADQAMADSVAKQPSKPVKFRVLAAHEIPGAQPGMMPVSEADLDAALDEHGGPGGQDLDDQDLADLDEILGENDR